MRCAKQTKAPLGKNTEFRDTSPKISHLATKLAQCAFTSLKPNFQGASWAITSIFSKSSSFLALLRASSSGKIMMDMIFLGNKMGAALKKVGWLVARLKTWPARLDAITCPTCQSRLRVELSNAYMAKLADMVGAMVWIPFLVKIQQLLQGGQLHLVMDTFQDYEKIHMCQKTSNYVILTFNV